MGLQRGRALSNAEMCTSKTGCWTYASFNGAALFRTRRYRRRGGARVALPRRFNGAALFRTRRCFSKSVLPLAQLASTGPRSFERGDGFAGGGVFRGRNRLQRGRALSNAEIPQGDRAVDVVGAASTGPRSFERGDSSWVSDWTDGAIPKVCERCGENRSLEEDRGSKSRLTLSLLTCERSPRCP